MGTASVSQIFFCPPHPEDFFMLSSSDHFFPNWFGLFVDQDYWVRTDRIDYKRDDTQLRLQKADSPLIWSGTIPEIPEEVLLPVRKMLSTFQMPQTHSDNTEQYYSSSQASARKKRQSYICRRQLTRGIPQGLSSV